jgi:hypothetical protein
MVVYTSFVQGQRIRRDTRAYLGILLVGLCIGTVDHLRCSLLGAIIAVLAVITTTIYQTQTNALQGSHNVTWIPLNRAVSVGRLVIALIASLAIEKYGQDSTGYICILDDDFRVVEAAVILVTGGLTLMGNRVGFCFIGWGGAITFQGVGLAARMMVTPVRFYLDRYGHDYTLKRFIGLALAMHAVIFYTYSVPSVK